MPTENKKFNDTLKDIEKEINLKIQKVSDSLYMLIKNFEIKDPKGNTRKIQGYSFLTKQALARGSVREKLANEDYSPLKNFGYFHESSKRALSIALRTLKTNEASFALNKMTLGPNSARLIQQSERQAETEKARKEREQQKADEEALKKQQHIETQDILSGVEAQRKDEEFQEREKEYLKKLSDYELVEKARKEKEYKDEHWAEIEASKYKGTDEIGGLFGINNVLFAIKTGIKVLKQILSVVDKIFKAREKYFEARTEADTRGLDKIEAQAFTRLKATAGFDFAGVSSSVSSKIGSIKFLDDNKSFLEDLAFIDTAKTGLVNKAVQYANKQISMTDFYDAFVKAYKSSGREDKAIIASQAGLGELVKFINQGVEFGADTTSFDTIMQKFLGKDYKDVALIQTAGEIGESATKRRREVKKWGENFYTSTGYIPQEQMSNYNEEQKKILRDYNSGLALTAGGYNTNAYFESFRPVEQGANIYNAGTPMTTTPLNVPVNITSNEKTITVSIDDKQQNVAVSHY